MTRLVGSDKKYDKHMTLPPHYDAGYTGFVLVHNLGKQIIGIDVVGTRITGPNPPYIYGGRGPLTNAASTYGIIWNMESDLVNNNQIDVGLFWLIADPGSLFDPIDLYLRAA